LPCSSLSLHDALPICLRVVAVCRAGGIKDTLQVDVHLVLEHELPEVQEPLVAGHLLPLDGHPDIGIQVIAGVVQRPNPTLPDLQDRKSTRLNSSHGSI